MKFRSNRSPKTPAERQAKCRAIKRGEWHTIPGTPCGGPHALPSPTGQPIAALPAPAASGETMRALPAPSEPTVTAMQKGTPAACAFPATSLALPDTALALSDAVTSGDVLRLSLPPAVAARLRSLLERQDAGKPLTAAERDEAQGLLDIAEFFVLQRLRQRFAA